MAIAPTIPSRGSNRTVRLFDGVKKTTRAWDGLRKDDELWTENGDCLVHLYAPGSSRRGASLKVPLEKLQQTGSHYLLRECLYKPSHSTEEEDHSDSGYAPSNSSERDGQCWELYVSAPVELSRQQAFLYHIGTRNYFAYLLNKPIVGETFGSALAHLWTRIGTWQSKGRTSPQQQNTFRSFCQEQGYLEFAANLEYAAAALFWSEQARVRDIWIDAFAHCVGMYDQPDREEKLKMLSGSTQASLQKASLEMYLNVARATKSLGSFLEEELGPEHLGLSRPSRDHLDRFRSTLHSFYVNEFGYFPPAQRDPWERRMWVRIYNDFHCLYKYLADTTSSNGMSNKHGLNGGICVTQNIKAFDESYGFSSLNHPRPLLPEVATRRHTLDPWSSLAGYSKGLGTTDSDLLVRASNSTSQRVMNNRLVQEYITFEREKPVEKVTAAEARKVRWLLVYGVLQMLISVTKAPKEVRDSKTPSYPLCVSTHDLLLPWGTEDAEQEQKKSVVSIKQVVARLSAEIDFAATTITNTTPPIQPDCEASNAEDYFSSTTSNPSTRRNSSMSLSMTPQPLRPLLPSRTSSIRSGVMSMRRSMVGSLTRRNTPTQTSSSTPIPAVVTSSLAISTRSRTSQYREILIEGYGNGADLLPAVPVSRNVQNFSGLHLNTLVENIPSSHHHHHPSSAISHVSSSSSAGGWSHSRRSAGSTTSSSSCSHSSGGRSSLDSPMTELNEEYDSCFPEPKTLIVSSSSVSPVEEFSTFDFGLREDKQSQKNRMTMMMMSGGGGGSGVVQPPPRTSSKSIVVVGTPLSAAAAAANVNANRERHIRKESAASSIYPAEGVSVQAGDIEETDVRGRGILRIN